MPVPWMLYGGVSSLHALYQARYTWKQAQENKKFWDTYYKNTGFRPRYPYRAGAVNNYGSLFNAVSTPMATYAHYRYHR